ncbi:hypothetical protein CWI35_03700 [[Bacillus] caldolyticus]|uniref:Uncharacterized protein n=3 Tax=Geobacillus thermoleovorans group TaxID=1505648 RepID=S4NMQ2_GEOKU|nr:hypothetical protein CWI35_03700 [[Bacillus] caldolyticus]GAD12245.1 hypothetical protein GBL_0462 [Geobacillus kaustophilus GBlys]
MRLKSVLRGAFFLMGALSLSPNRGRLPGGKKEGTSNGAGAYNELYGIMIHLLCTLAEMAHRMK